MKICIISDTHNKHRLLDLPSADVLIHCGDATMGGTVEEFAAFGNWFGKLPYNTKLFVPGNHDFLAQSQPAMVRELLGEEVEMLIDRRLTVVDIDKGEVLKVYGTPWVPNLARWAFYGTGEKLAHQFAQIPDDTQILISHGPPQGIFDEIPGMLFPSSRLRDDEISNAEGDGLHVGSSALSQRTLELANLKLHCFGHIHEGYGSGWRMTTEPAYQIVNASNCDEVYNLINPPIVVDIAG